MNDYFRAFVALTEEQSGFSIAGKKAFGKAIIEARGTEGKLLVSVQGLQPDAFYKVYLVAKNIGTPSSRFSGVFMGNLPVNDKGVADIKIPFNAHSVANSGFMVGLFSAVAIIVHNAPALTAPLVGYVSEPVFWKNGFEIFKIEEEVKEATGTKCEATEEPTVVEAVVEETIAVNDEPIIETVVTETANAPTVHTKFKDYVQSYHEETDETSIPESSPNLQATPQDDPPEEPNWETADTINELFRINAKMAPFIRPDPNIEWRRIAPEHAALIGLQEVAASDFAAQAFQRYKHLVLGRVPGSRYILGIPDMYTLETASALESKGFAFKRCDGKEVVENSYGYWIIVV